MTRSRVLFVLLTLTLGCAGSSSRTSSTGALPTPSDDATVSTSSSVVVAVNGEGITRAEVLELLVARSGEQALQTLIVGKLLEQEARRLGIVLTAADVEGEVEREVARAGGWEELRTRLLRLGWTESDFRKAARTQALIFKILSQQGKLASSEDELKELYESRYGSRAIVQMIVVKTLREAKTIQDKLKAGESFVPLARLHSIDKSRGSGGVLGPVGRGELLPELDRVVFSLQPGQTSAIVSSPMGFHIFELINYTEPQHVPYQQVKQELEEELLDRKFSSAREELIRNLRARANIIPADPQSALERMLSGP